MDVTSTQLAVIGGGAAGLAAAITAAQAGTKVLILEKLPRIGKKLLLTGNGRCNLSNRDLSPAHYHGHTPQAAEILSQYGDAEDFFARLGLYCRADSAGRLYPASNAAASVLDALRLAADRLGVRILCDCTVERITPQKSGFLLATSQGTVSAALLVFAAGGYAAPACGTDGSAMKLLRALGHTITTPVPALAPIRCQAPCLKSLKGVRVQAEVTAFCGGKVLARESGEVQFAEGALSGICVFNLARYAAHPNGLTLSINLFPELSHDELQARLEDILRVRADAPLEDLLTGLLPKRIGQVLCKAVQDAPLTTPASSLSRKALGSLCLLMQDWRFGASGTAPWQSAQVTAGGVPGKELTHTLASKQCKGLFLAGEAVDVDGDCGGFNLAWAWASGRCAGRAASRNTEDSHDSDS